MALASSVSSPSQSERRFHARRRIDGLAYVDSSASRITAAILIDLGEGGLGFQSVAPVILDQAVLLKFKLPTGGASYIESYAEVVWLNDSGKGGGLRFSELNAEARAQIRAWTGVLATEAKPEVKPEVEPEAKPEAKLEVKPEVSAEVLRGAWPAAMRSR